MSLDHCTKIQFWLPSQPARDLVDKPQCGVPQKKEVSRVTADQPTPWVPRPSTGLAFHPQSSKGRRKSALISLE